MSEDGLKTWGMLELMGHRQRYGLIEEVEIAASKMLRVTMPCEGGDIDEFYGGASIYSIRPMSEEMVRDHYRDRGDPRPLRPAEYRQAAGLPAPDEDFDEIYDYDENQ